MKISHRDDMGSVLIVDDDADSREVVAKFLMKAGYHVRSAENGRYALIAVASAMPDVIILDFQMPEMNGIEFLKVIRSYLRWSSVPVILLTAYDRGAHIDLAAELGVKMVFLKGSYQLADLLACVHRLRSEPGASFDTVC